LARIFEGANALARIFEGANKFVPSFVNSCRFRFGQFHYTHFCPKLLQFYYTAFIQEDAISDQYIAFEIALKSAFNDPKGQVLQHTLPLARTTISSPAIGTKGRVSSVFSA
jgi:hypothetical protein